MKHVRIAIAVAFAAVMPLPADCAERQLLAAPDIARSQGDNRSDAVAQTLTVMTLNTAHGRGTGFHQALQSTARQIRNLDRIGEVLQRERADLVALQEVDGESIWSGNFCHVLYLAEAAQYSERARSDLVDRPGFNHGTALLSTLPLEETLAVRFEPAVAGTAKGFVLSTIEWPGRPNLLVDVVSVHLEAFRPSLRARQVDELIASIEGRQRPLIVMGDFNTGWNGRRESLKKLAEALDLKAHDPESPDHVSLPVFNRRLDWILISREFEFRSYRTLGDPVSDHRAVVAEIELRRPEAQHSEERIGDARSNDRGQT